MTEEERKSYEAGFQNGRADKRIGVRSTYAWTMAQHHDPIPKAYGRGYRDGWNGKEHK